jgi:hypothetical protein
MIVDVLAGLVLVLVVVLVPPPRNEKQLGGATSFS